MSQTIRLADNKGRVTLPGFYNGVSELPDTLRALQQASRQAKALGMAVHAGHGLTLENVGPVAAIPECEELNIGHSIVSHAVFVGISEAVRAMRKAMYLARPR